jgi:hypothetical protein
MCLAPLPLHQEEQRLADEISVSSNAAPDDALKAPEREPEPAPEPVAERLGGRHMLMVAAVLIGSGAFMIGVLNARGGASPDHERKAAPPAMASTSRSVEATLSPSRGWVENSAAWTGGLRRSIAFEVAARNETPVWMKTVRPLLVVRCVKGRTDAFVVTDSPAAMEPQDEDHTVRISFDSGEVRTERWPDSTEHDALFAPDGAAFTARLVQGRTLRFGYTPHNASPVVAHFDVSGLADKLAGARAACGK